MFSYRRAIFFLCNRRVRATSFENRYLLEYDAGNKRVFVSVKEYDFRSPRTRRHRRRCRRRVRANKRSRA